ncbi:hypothetical protein [Bacillus amyloliquefaciens]|uniref:hypothetical protein n=1 Tax=Bacillus amyloliquefaciens TaxID=1390 RepID=UPI001DF18948|nr:hypothetical protein [Bacillus amyloliquefaciens]MCB5337179.1 hypothetical protein [Bacillus amyloliquefaciens]
MSKVTTGILSAKGLTIGGIAAVTVAAGVTTGVVLHNKHNGDNDKNVPASQTQDENNTSDVVGSKDKKSKDSKDVHEDLVERAIENEKKTEVAQAVGDIANSGFDQHDTLVAKAVTGDQTIASILKDTETTKIGDKQLVAIVGEDTKSILDTQTPIADAGDTNKGKIGDNINVIPTDNRGGNSSSPTQVPNTPSDGVKDDQGEVMYRGLTTGQIRRFLLTQQTLVMEGQWIQQHPGVGMLLQQIQQHLEMVEQHRQTLVMVVEQHRQIQQTLMGEVLIQQILVMVEVQNQHNLGAVEQHQRIRETGVQLNRQIRMTALQHQRIRQIQQIRVMVEVQNLLRTWLLKLQ